MFAPQRQERGQAHLAEPGAARYRSGIDDAENRERNRERNKHVGQIAGHAQCHRAAYGCNRQAGEIGDERPCKPAGTLRGEI